MCTINYSKRRLKNTKLKTENHKTKRDSLSINNSTMLPNLPSGPGLNTNSSHFLHRLGKFLKEKLGRSLNKLSNNRFGP